MISRSRSMSTDAAIAAERTTSANNTVTCLYSATPGVSGEPHVAQNRAPSCGCTPHDRHTDVADVTAPPLRAPSIVSQGYGCAADRARVFVGANWQSGQVSSPKPLAQEAAPM